MTAREEIAEVTRLNFESRRASAESVAIDPVGEARWVLQLVKARMEAGDLTPGLIAQHTQLVAEIARLEKAATQIEKVSALDQLAQRRADRLAGSAD